MNIPKASFQAAYNRTALAEQKAWQRKDNARHAALCRWGKAEEERSYAVSLRTMEGTFHGAYGMDYRRKRDAQRVAHKMDDPNNTARHVFVERWTVYK